MVFTNRELCLFFIGERIDKITKGENSYLVLQKKFEEGLPDYVPPSSQYKVVSEFPF